MFFLDGAITEIPLPLYFLNFVEWLLYYRLSGGDAPLKVTF